jgi:DNA primase
VLLLPNGEDPDSFARTHGASGFQQFIREHETDFIRFKTELLMKSAGNDPIAKARLITDVVRSVAVIPDNITRSVYIKECSNLLDVSEEILYAEVRKQKRKENDDFRRGEQRRQESTTTAPRQTQTAAETPADALPEEREILRVLLKYGKYPLFELDGELPGEVQRINVGEYIIESLESDDLVPADEHFRTIFYDCRDRLKEESFDPSKYFIYHTNAGVSKLATDLLTDKFIESKRWSRAGAYTEKEEDLLDYLVPRIINEYKLRKVKLLLAEIEQAIDKASKENDFDLVIAHQSKYMNLKQVEKFLSDNLGNRAII